MTEEMMIVKKCIRSDRNPTSLDVEYPFKGKKLERCGIFMATAAFLSSFREQGKILSVSHAHFLLQGIFLT